MSGNGPTGPPPGPQRQSFPPPATPAPAAPGPRRKVLTHAAAALGGLLVGVLIGIVGSGGGAAEPPPAAQATTTPQPSESTDASQAPESAEASRPVASSTPTKSAGPTTEIPGDGTFLVGKDIQPGTYRSDGKDSTVCYWARLDDTTGEFEDIIANGNAKGQVIVKVSKSDKAFKTSDCKPWQKID